MKVLCVMGNLREKSQTKKVVDMVRDEVECKYNIQFEYIWLNRINLQFCRGCAVCLEIGEEKCPLKDEHLLVIKKMTEADAIIFATPNYALQVTYLMKNFWDRSAYIMHRPIFFGTVFSSIVTQIVYGGRKINKYFFDASKMVGGYAIKGLTVTVPEGTTFYQKRWTDQEIDEIKIRVSKYVKRLIKAMNTNRFKRPSLTQLIAFLFSRASHKYSNRRNCDSLFFEKNGWFDSNYYYKVKLSFFQKIISKLIDFYLKNKFSFN